MTRKEVLEVIYRELLMGATFKKKVAIEYKYLDDSEKTKARRYGMIEPIKWLTGRKGDHILCWDHEAGNWRRFAVANIINIKMTNENWETDLVSAIAVAR